MMKNFTSIIYSALGIQRAQYMSLTAVFLLKANISLIDLLISEFISNQFV